MAKGCWRVRIGKKLKVEQAAYRRSRPQWSVTSALGPVHPMAPQGATRVGGRKSLRHTLLVPFRRLPPLVAGATTFAPVVSVSLDSQSPKGSLRIQFPCHPAKAGALWVLGISGNLRMEQQRKKTKQPGWRPWKCTPFVACGTTFPPRGGLLAALCNEQLKLAQGESIEQTSPSGGSTAAGGDRGAFPSGRRPGLPVFPARQGGFKVLSKLAPQEPTTTL